MKRVPTTEEAGPARRQARLLRLAAMASFRCVGVVAVFSMAGLASGFALHPDALARLLDTRQIGRETATIALAAWLPGVLIVGPGVIVAALVRIAVGGGRWVAVGISSAIAFIMGVGSVREKLVRSFGYAGSITNRELLSGFVAAALVAIVVYAFWSASQRVWRWRRPLSGSAGKKAGMEGVCE